MQETKQKCVILRPEQVKSLDYQKSREKQATKVWQVKRKTVREGKQRPLITKSVQYKAGNSLPYSETRVTSSVQRSLHK